MLRINKAWLATGARVFLTVLLGCSVNACADVETPAGAPAELSAADAEALQNRVRERWQTLVAKDFESTWEFSTPNYRSNFPKALYIHNFSYAIDWELTKVEIVHYDAAAAVASVAVGVMSLPVKLTSSASKAVGAVPITIHERWIFIDGEWWHSANY